MAESKKITEITGRLRTVWKRYPDLRLGQLIAGCANYQQIYYLDDESLMRLIEASYKDNSEKKDR